MKRTAIAAILAVSATSVFAQATPSFDDFADQYTRTAAVERNSLGNAEIAVAPSFADYVVAHQGAQGLAGRPASEARAESVQPIATQPTYPAY
jgi:hypothetical protein